MTLYIGCTGTDLDLYLVTTVVASYMLARSSKAGPFFTQTDGRYLTRDYFVAAGRTALTAGLTVKNYAYHSFHIGAVTMAAQRGLLGCLIKPWVGSRAYKYIWILRETLVKVARALVSNKK